MALSDEELRHRLTGHGCDVGPIDDTTRPLYLSLLKRRESDAKPTRQGRSSTGAVTSPKGRSIRNHTLVSSDDDEPPAPVVPKKNASPRKSSQATTNRKKRDTDVMMPSSSSTMYMPSPSQYGEGSLFSAGLSPVRSLPTQSPKLTENKYTRRPLHPPNYSYSGSNGFSDDESDYRYRTSSAGNNGVAHDAHMYSGNSGYRGSRNRRHNLQTLSAPSHPIPKLLVGIIALFFCVLAALYFRQIQIADPSEIVDDRSLFKYKLCSPEQQNADGYDCIDEAVLQDSLDSAKKIQKLLLQEYYGKFCANDGHRLDSSNGLPYTEATSVLGGRDNVFNGMLYLVQENPVWGMELSHGETQSSIKLPTYSPPLLCQLYQAVMQVIYHILLLIMIALLLFASIWLLQKRNKNLEERKRQINGLVEDITEMLTNNAADHPETPYLALLEIRDKLLPNAAHNKKARQLWAEVEEKFELTENVRVAKEKHRIHGEWFVVWRWLRPPSANGGGKVWQGKAFDGNHRVQPLTSCLKIRNMFKKTEEHGDGWVFNVKRAIVDKCGPNHGITHIHVAQESAEGLVFVKMNSLAAAGDVYHELHGSWFDGRLVTAKYLREDRYHEKFPDSINCKRPIQIS